MRADTRRATARGAMMRRFLVFGFAALLALAGCEAPPPEVEEVIRPVRYMAIANDSGERNRLFSGVARAGVESRLSFKVSGNLERVDVSVGDTVKPGDAIATLDASDFRLQLQEAQAYLLQVQAQARNAEASLDRVRALYENNNVSQAEFDNARAQRDSTRAQVNSAEKAVALARRQLSYTNLTAPIAGNIAAVLAEVNENIQAGQAIATITSEGDLEVNISVPETLIGQIRSGDTGAVTFDAIADETFQATVTEVGVASTGAATTFPVTLRLVGDDDRIRPGMAADVTFSFRGTERKEGVVLVPPVAVSEDREGKYVFIVEPKSDDRGTISRRSVETGDLGTEGLEILNGLSEGELIVTAGVSKISDGIQVKLLERFQDSPQ